MLNRREFLSSAVAAATPTAHKRPNLLFLVADEWRGQALPSAGNPDLKTPNLSRLASQGIDFRRAYTSYAVCCPSRAAMLTGKFPHAAGVPHNHMQLPLGEKTVSAELKRAGYRTGYVGKWHLDGSANPGFVPADRRRGFDYWAAYNVQHKQYGSVYFRDTAEPVPIPGFEPDSLTNLAIDFLRQERKEPFFLYLSWVAPHPPLTPPARNATYDPGRIHLPPNVPASSEAETRKQLAAYYGLCEAIDGNVGRLLAELDARGLTEDTIVVFTSDHGGTFGSHGVDEIDLPLEEASRIPLLIRYPRRIKPRVERTGLISNVDFAPTWLGLCGLPQMPGTQGANLAGWLTGQDRTRDLAVFSEGRIGARDEWRMVVRGWEKLVVDSHLKPTQLFDLRLDPYEMNNRVSDRAFGHRREALLVELRRAMERNHDRLSA